MNTKYQLSQPESDYLIMLAGQDKMLEMSEKERSGEAWMAAARNSLIEKGYIREDEEKGMQILSPLMWLLQSIYIYDAAFCGDGIQRDGKKQSFGFYFYEDKISFAEQKEQQCELFEVPSLSLAIGMLANRIEIKGETTEIIKQISAEEITEELDLEEIDLGQAEEKWTLIGIDRRDKKAQCMLTVRNTADGQMMMRLGMGQITISRPGKADFFNICMDWMRQVQAAMR